MSWLDFKAQNPLLDALPTCVIVHDAHSKDILWANQAACRTLGFSVEELLPLKAYDMSASGPRYQREIGIARLEEARIEGTATFEWCYRAKNGQTMLSEATATLTVAAGREILLVQFRDVSLEEQLKQELRRSNVRYQEFMKDLGEGISVLSAQGEVLYMSEVGSRMLEYPHVELNGKDFLSLCDPASAKQLRSMLDSAGDDTRTYSLRYRILTGSGQWRWHHSTCRFIDMEGDLRGHLVLFRDVTEHVLANEAQRQAEQHLEYLARHNAMGEMAMTIAHELSQPLAASHNFVEGASMRLLTGEGSTAEIAWGLQNAIRQIEHASTIIKSVRAYVVKLDQAEMPVDLNDIASEVLYFIRLKAEQSVIHIKLDLWPDTLPISCERVLIGQVILNFAFNAIDEMNKLPVKRHELCISTLRVDGRCVLAVSDTGPGLPTGRKLKMFDGFFSGKSGGNGIGLALSKSIINRHRGDIWAENGKERGAIFSFSLPALSNVPTSSSGS